MSAKRNPVGNALKGLECLVSIMALEKRPLPDLTHEHAIRHVGPGALVMSIKMGDQIAVRSSDNHHYHHGIYIGKITESEYYWVVDFGGPDKSNATVSLRPYDDFCRGCDVFVHVAWPAGAIDRTLADSAQIAVRVAQHCAKHDVVDQYHALDNNCETIASMCRTGRCDPRSGPRVRSLVRSLLPLPAPVPEPYGLLGTWKFFFPRLSWW